MRYSWDNTSSFSELLGKTLLEVKIVQDDYQDEIHFITADGKYIMTHDQECCEDVHIEEIIGNLDDLIGTPIVIVMAEENFNEGESDWGTSTWTFYKLATIKGYVTIRWFGESNGCYSESVDMYFIPNNKEEN